MEDSPEEINVVIYDDEDMKYPMEPNEEFDSDVLSEFVEQYKNGLLLLFELTITRHNYLSIPHSTMLTCLIKIY